VPAGELVGLRLRRSHRRLYQRISEKSIDAEVEGIKHAPSFHPPVEKDAEDQRYSGECDETIELGSSQRLFTARAKRPTSRTRSRFTFQTKRYFMNRRAPSMVASVRNPRIG